MGCRKLKDVGGNGSKTRHWEFLFSSREKENQLADSIKVAAQGWVYEVERIDFTWVSFVLGLLQMCEA